LPVLTVKIHQEEAYLTYWSQQGVPRIRRLVHRYADLPLGFGDAAAVACAERHGGRVLTMDRRHFLVVARGEKTITVLPE
jgi:predicted nucleic acid-binding protein